MKKPTMEVARRVEKVGGWLRERLTSGEIYRLAADTWGVTHRQAATYVKRARALTPAHDAELAAASSEIDSDLAAFDALGPPPSTSALEGVTWMQRAIIAATGHLVRERGLKPGQRRAEIVKLARAAAALVPQEEIADAVTRIKANAAGQDDRAPMTETKHEDTDDGSDQSPQPDAGRQTREPGRRPALRL